MEANSNVEVEDVQIDEPVERNLRDGLDRSCGWLRLRPQFLQSFAKPKWFLIFQCGLVLTQGMIVTGMSGVVISSIEKRFFLKSKEVGALTACYDFAAACMAIVVSYYGHSHKPRWLGVGAAVLGVGCFCFALPHLLVGNYEIGMRETSDLCFQNTTGINADLWIHKITCKSAAWYNIFVFVIAECLIGFGATPVYILGTAYIDENVRHTTSGMYLGIMYAIATTGPAIGYLLGGQFLTIYVDVTQPKGMNMNPEDTNFIGAWWLGYVFGGVLALIVSIPLLAFPKELPETPVIRKEKQELSDTVPDHNLPHTFKELLPSLKQLLTNRTFVLLSLGGAFEGFAVGSLSTFLPKFIQAQFHLSASRASIYTGLCVVPGGGGGMLLGGFLIKKLKWTCKQITKACFVIALLALLSGAIMLLGCDNRHFEIPSPTSQGMAKLESNCNTGCSCDSQDYNPICFKATQVTYFSKCYAGCRNNSVSSGNLYTNCSCFPTPGEAVHDACIPDCNRIIPFLIGLFVLMFLTFMNNIPATTATLRCVPESQGSFALGIQQLMTRILGFIPGPVVLGTIIDLSCKVHQTDPCDGSSKNCLEYDNKQLRYSVAAVGAIFKLLSVLSFFFAWKTYKPQIHMSNSSTFTKCLPSDSAASDGDTGVGDEKVCVQLSNITNVRTGSTNLDSPDEPVVDNGMISSLSTENLTEAFVM